MQPKTPKHHLLEKLAHLPARQREMLRSIIRLADMRSLENKTPYDNEFTLLVNDSELSAASRRVCKAMIKLRLTVSAADTVFACDYEDMLFNDNLQKIKNELTVYLKPKNWRLLTIADEKEQQWWELKKWDVLAENYTLFHISHGICEHSNKIVYGMQSFKKAKNDKPAIALGSAIVTEFESVLDLINFMESK